MFNFENLKTTSTAEKDTEQKVRIAEEELAEYQKQLSNKRQLIGEQLRNVSSEIAGELRSHGVKPGILKEAGRVRDLRRFGRVGFAGWEVAYLGTDGINDEALSTELVTVYDFKVTQLTVPSLKPVPIKVANRLVLSSDDELVLYQNSIPLTRSEVEQHSRWHVSQAVAPRDIAVNPPRMRPILPEVKPLDLSVHSSETVVGELEAFIQGTFPAQS